MPEKIIEHVKKELDSGLSPKEVKDKLTGENFNEKEVEEALKKALKKKEEEKEELDLLKGGERPKLFFLVLTISIIIFLFFALIYAALRIEPEMIRELLAAGF